MGNVRAEAGVTARCEAVVIGRVGLDFHTGAPEIALEDVERFPRAVGGYGGNVSTGLARLGVRTAVIAAVGDDGHGRFIRRFLDREGVDVSGLRTDPRHRTPLAFYEIWPPEQFPVTFYPSPAYWALAPGQIRPDVLAAPLVLLSATTLAWEPSRTIVLEALAKRRAAARSAGPNHGWTILDLDWRPVLWADPADAPSVVAAALPLADVVIGSEAEFAALELSPETVAGSGDVAVYLKRGELGARFLRDGTTLDADPIRVETLCGIGSGDAFAAAVGEGLLRGREPATIIRRANAAGAIVATRLTCSEAMPTEGEIEGLLQAPDGSTPRSMLHEEAAR
jgi:5-dehydro-2-deoxygluconokinase